MSHCHLRRFLTAAAVWVALEGSSAHAAPPENAWIDDLRLHPSGPSELDMTYDFIDPGGGAVDSEIDVLTLSTRAGFDRVPMDFAPSVSMVQAGVDELRLYHVGLRVRYRLCGTTTRPGTGLGLGYRMVLYGEHEHEFDQGLVGRYLAGRLTFGWEAGLRERTGREGGVEGRVGASASTSTAIGFIHMALEAFALVPIVGNRLTDFGVGGQSDTPALYVGPSVRADTEYMWIDVGVVTGRLLDDGADVMVRATLATQF